MVPGMSRQTSRAGWSSICLFALCRSKRKLSWVRVRMMMPTITSRKPAKNRTRQPQETKSCGVISDLVKITEPKPSSNPIGMANPTHAPQKARCFECAACSTTQVEAVPNSAPKLIPCISRKTISSTGAATPMLS